MLLSTFLVARPGIRHYCGFAVLSAALAQCAIGGAQAQAIAPEPVPDLTGPQKAPEEISVAQRGDPVYDPMGMRMGGFILSASAFGGETYESNVFAVHSGAQSDFATIIRPAFDIVSDWNTHAIGLHAEADVAQFSRFSTENVGDVILSGQGRLDIHTGQYLQLVAGYQSLEAPRSQPDLLQAVQLAGGTLAKNPTDYSVSNAALSYVYSPGLVKVALDGGVINYQYTNTPTNNGGLAINSDQNRNEYTFATKVGYQYLPGYQIYLQAAGNAHQYDQSTDATPARLDRNSSGYAAALGVDFDVSAKITGTFFAGYRGQFFDDPRLSTIEGLYAGGSALWNVTDATSLRATLSRTIDDTVVIGSAGFWDTQASLAVEQQILETVLATGTISAISEDYKGSSLSNDIYDAKAALVWKLNPHLDLEPSAEWLHQDSNVTSQRFDQAIIQLALKLKL